MSNRIVAHTLLLATACLGFALCPAQASDSGQSVILITLDGVRPQDVLTDQPDPAMQSRLPESLRGRSFIPDVLADFRANGRVFSDFKVSNGVNWSLPGYQSMMAGQASTGCTANSCGRIKHQTLPQSLLEQLELPGARVGVVGSWATLKDAASSSKGPRPYVSVGPEPAPIVAGSSLLAEINARLVADKLPESHFWKGVRRDQHTGLIALEYLKQRPRFLWVSFNDMDSWGHLDRYDEYAASLTRFNLWYRQLRATLSAQGYTDANTTIILTTDHSRGSAPDRFQFHGGPNVPEAAQIWMMAQGPTVSHEAKPDQRVYSHADLRPTIEALLGACRDTLRTCEGCGSVIAEIAYGKFSAGVCGNRYYPADI